MPRKKVSSPEDSGASALAQADIKVKDSDASSVAMTPSARLLRFLFLERNAMRSRANGW